MSLCCTANAQSRAQDDVYLVPDPQTARWSYMENDADGKPVGMVYTSVESMEGDAVNGYLRLRVDEVPLASPEDTLTSFAFYRFKDGEYMMDLSAVFERDLLSSAISSALEKREEEISEEEIEEAIEKMKSHFKTSGEIRGIPRHPKVGKLPDFDYQLKLSIFSMKVQGEQRRIVGTERIHTEAGSFDCFILEETITMKIMMVKEVEKIRSWYAYGIGMVKENTYDKKDKLISTMILKEINW